MTRKWDRKNVGLWFIGILSLILGAIGIWYAKYTDWWAQWVNRDQPNLQTVNTGASVFVTTMTTPGSGDSSVKPETVNPPVTPSPEAGSNSAPPSRMW